MSVRIVIVGGGFAGVKCARTLSKRLRGRDAEIILFNRENHLVFSPLLADAVGSSLNPLDVVAPLREMLPRVQCRTEDVQHILTETNDIEYETHDGKFARMGYDHLVLALGVSANLTAVPGMADHGFPLKSIGDATALRSHILQQLEKAEVCSDADMRRWYLSFIVVGGGYSGVEAAGEINDLARSTRRYFQNIRAEDVSVHLLQSAPEILPDIGPSLRRFARAKMEKAGVRVLEKTYVQTATPDGVRTRDGELIRGATIVCTVGTAPAPLIQRLHARKDRGRLVTGPDMRIEDSSNVWAIGDCACIPNAHDGQPSPPTGQFAERQGNQAANNIASVLDGGPTKPFSFKPLGQLCSIGGYSAVAEIFGIRLSGFLAWFTWRGVYLFKLPSWSRRAKVGLDWAWLLIFPRDLSHIRSSDSGRVSHAHYEAGDYIFRQGDAPSGFYVLEQGYVEIVRESAEGREEIVAVIGPGSFFGERALVDNRPRSASVRARTAVEVIVVGRNAFGQMSKALAPLRDAIAKSINDRAVDPWKGQPQAQALLAATPVRQLLEPHTQPMLKPDAPLRDVVRAFAQHENDVFYISADGARLGGVVTMTDLVQAQSAGMDQDTPVERIMSAKPVVISADEPADLAAGLLREYHLKSLPVVEGKEGRIAGCIKARRVMAFVLNEIRADGPIAPD